MMIPDIPVVDVWPMLSLDRSRMTVYHDLADQGLIRIQKIYFHRKSGITVFHYLSVMEKEKTHEALRNRFKMEET